MAWVRDVTPTWHNGVSPAVALMPVFYPGDLLFIFIMQQAGYTTFATSTPGYSVVYQRLNNTQRGGFITCVATETTVAPSITVRAWQHVSIFTFSIADADTSTPIDAYNYSDWTSVNNPTCPNVTTTSADALLLYAVSSSNAGVQFTHGSCDKIFEYTSLTTTPATHCIGKNQEFTSGLKTGVVALGTNATSHGVALTVAIKNATGGSIDIRTVQNNNCLRQYRFPVANFSSQHAYAWFTTVGGTPVSTVDRTVSAYTSSLTFGEITTGTICGLWDTFSSAVNLYNKLICFEFIIGGVTWARMGSLGFFVAVADSTNAWKAVRVLNTSEYGGLPSTPFTAVIDVTNNTALDGSGTVDFTDIVKFGFFYHRVSAGVNSDSLTFISFCKLDPITVVGGGPNRPISSAVLSNYFNGISGLNTGKLQGSGQLIAAGEIVIGDGSTYTYADFSGTSAESILPYNVSKAPFNKFSLVKSMGVKVNIPTGSTAKFGGSILKNNNDLDTFTIDSASSISGVYSFGIISRGTVVLKSGLTVSGTFVECKEIDAKAATFTNCTISAATGTYAIEVDNGASLAGTAFTKGSDTYAIRMREAGAYNLTDTTFSGYTTPIKITATTGTVTITLASGQSQPSYSSDGATVAFDQPLQECGLTINNLLSGSQVVVYEAGTTTEIERDDNTGTTFEWSQYAASVEVDYTIQKAGHLPQRFAGVTLLSVQESDANQQIDRAYTASSGLTFGTTATVTTSTNRFAVSTATTGQNWYSFLIESWISQSSLRNIQFPVIPNGPNSFTLVDWEFSSGSIPYLSRDGLRYYASGQATAIWAAILSVGTSAGMQVRYQQSDGGTTVEASATGPIDELVQIYGDSSHGNFDKRGYLKLKVQADGYDEATTDAIATYGHLEDQLYIVGLAPLSNGLTTGDPSVTGVTITDHGASPVTWNSKAFSITITDSGTNSGEDIMRWLRYNFDAGGTFQGADAFNWHDLVLINGDKFKTIRGPVYGDTGATLKGVRVLRGTDPHPDFDLFTADDGTTYAPPPAAVVTITGAVAGSRVQLYDLTADEELLNSTSTFTWSETYSADRQIRLRVMYAGEDTASVFIDTIIGTITESSPTISYLVDQSADEVYATNGIDGSTVTGITIDDDNLLISIDDTSISWGEIYAYETYWLSTEEGIRDEGRIIDAVDVANYRLYGFKIKNIGATALTITGGYGVDADTGGVLALFDTSGNSIFPAPDHVVAYSAGSEATVAIVQAGLTAQGVTSTRAGNLDRLDAAISTRTAPADLPPDPPTTGEIAAAITPLLPSEPPTTSEIVTAIMTYEGP